ncbi:MAG: HEPN domain-containing protein [Planctomycetes bacterium]|nr:HEPN domain-containing protein [Planctomycetota bacterium]
MIDVPKQIAHWRDSAQEDWAVARELVDRGRNRHGLFFAHLALEKALKAHVCAKTQKLAPRTHNLVRLAELASLTLKPEQADALAEMNTFALEGRYPETLLPPPNEAEARRYMTRAEEVFQCLIRQL